MFIPDSRVHILDPKNNSKKKNQHHHKTPHEKLELLAGAHITPPIIILIIKN